PSLSLTLAAASAAAPRAAAAASGAGPRAGKLDAVAILDGERAGRDHALAFIHAVEHLNTVGVLQPGLHRTEVGDQLIDDVDAALALEIDDRVPGHGQRVRLAIDGQRHARVHTRLQPEPRIRDLDLHHSRPRRSVEDRRDAADFAGEFLAREGVDLDACCESLADSPAG